jgi:hypothetical protein
MAGTERQSELRRRRTRRRKVASIKRRAKNASSGTKAELARKLRRMTPGAELIITQLSLEG